MRAGLPTTYRWSCISCHQNPGCHCVRDIFLSMAYFSNNRKTTFVGMEHNKVKHRKCIFSFTHYGAHWQPHPPPTSHLFLGMSVQKDLLSTALPACWSVGQWSALLSAAHGQQAPWPAKVRTVCPGSEAATGWGPCRINDDIYWRFAWGKTTNIIGLTNQGYMSMCNVTSTSHFERALSSNLGS